MQNGKCSTVCANGFSAVSREGYYVECCVDKTIRKEGDACPFPKELDTLEFLERLRKQKTINPTIEIFRAMNNMNNYQKGQKETMRESNTERHKRVCYELNALYDRKNRDYGDSFHETFKQEGMAMSRIRLMDKLNRFCNLTRGQNVPNVASESVRDTLLDLSNYAIMTVMEMDAESGKPFPACDWVKEEHGE